MEHRGNLRSIDQYMNLQLVNTEEWMDGNFKVQPRSYISGLQ